MRKPAALALLPLLQALGAPLAAAPWPPLSPAQLGWVGARIFANECANRLECLTAWNEGEDFPSLGIGHFIWYRTGQEGAYTESFPALLRYLEAEGVKLPAWVREGRYANPWESREAFLAERDGERLAELREVLRDTMGLQAAFILRRFEGALADILASAPDAARPSLEARFLAVARADRPHGLYALIDYVNFKGEGTNPRERYRGQGWGLRQVLEHMADDSGEPLEAFVAAAGEVLGRRVDNAPAERNEARWLGGWQARLNTYLPPR